MMLVNLLSTYCFCIICTLVDFDANEDVTMNKAGRIDCRGTHAPTLTGYF